MQLIALADVLAIMDKTADPFDVVFVSADRQRKTGGELVSLQGCLATGYERDPKAPAAAAAGGGLEAGAAASARARRQPAHRTHHTRNVTILSSGKPRKLHVRLIVEFNGQTVRW